MMSEEIVPKDIEIWSKVFSSLSKGRQCCLLSLRLNFRVKHLAPDALMLVSIFMQVKDYRMNVVNVIFQPIQIFNCILMS